MHDYVEVRAERVDYGQRVDFQIFQLLEGGGVAIGDVVMREIDPEAVAPASFSLRPHLAQKLMDSLWQCGLRPSEGTGSAGALAATQDHLKDLRTLLFHSVGVQS